MKANFSITIFVSMVLACSMAAAKAAPGRGMGSGPMGQPARFTKAMTKVFGENSAFSADVEIQAAPEQGGKIPAKMVFDQGKTRFEMDMSKLAGAADMKAMGLDRMVMVSLPDKNSTITIYPGLKAYVQTDFEQDKEATKNQGEFTVKMTKEGEESVGGHPTIKNKVIVNEGTNAVYEAFVWNATDLKNFPVKIEQTGQGDKVTMAFKNVKLEKPASDMFEVPAGYTKYTDMMELMQSVMQKQTGQGGMNMPGLNNRKK